MFPKKADSGVSSPGHVRLAREVVDEQEEVHPLHDEEDDDEHPRERRDEEREELALVDGPERSHALVLAARSRVPRA